MLISLRGTIVSINEAVLSPIQETKDLYGFEVPPETLALIDRLSGSVICDCPVFHPTLIRISIRLASEFRLLQKSSAETLADHLAKTKSQKLLQRGEITDVITTVNSSIEAELKRFLVSTSRALSNWAWLIDISHQLHVSISADALLKSLSIQSEWCCIHLFL